MTRRRPKAFETKNMQRAGDPHLALELKQPGKTHLQPVPPSHSHSSLFIIPDDVQVSQVIATHQHQCQTLLLPADKPPSVLVSSLATWWLYTTWDQTYHRPDVHLAWKNVFKMLHNVSWVVPSSDLSSAPHPPSKPLCAPLPPIWCARDSIATLSTC